MASGSAFSNVLKAKEDLQKSPEQLEQEKRSVLAQRIPALHLDGKTKADLVEQVENSKSIRLSNVNLSIVFFSIGKRITCVTSTNSWKYLRIN